MKKVAALATLLLFLNASVILAYTSPGKPQGFVNDFADILTPQVEQDLEAKLEQVKLSSSNEIAVVTIDSLEDETIETYAVKLFEEWGIGNKEKDNGVLLLVAPIERKVRIEVGYGLESILTDAQSSSIIRNAILPDFKDGEMESGVISGVDGIISVINEGADFSSMDGTYGLGEGNAILDFLNQFPPLLFVVIFGLAVNYLAKSKSWWLGGVWGGALGLVIGFITSSLLIGGSVGIVLVLFGLLIDFLASKGHINRKGRGWGGGWGGGFRGGGGGGGSSFSGGSSGGGGSSGSW